MVASLINENSRCSQKELDTYLASLPQRGVVTLSVHKSSSGSPECLLHRTQNASWCGGQLCRTVASSQAELGWQVTVLSVNMVLITAWGLETALELSFI